MEVKEYKYIYEYSVLTLLALMFVGLVAGIFIGMGVAEERAKNAESILEGCYNE